MNILSKDQFIDLGTQAFRHEGATVCSASTVVDVLLEASLSGYDSHGVMRIPRYIDECHNGIIAAQAIPSIMKDSGGPIAMVDGELALGPVTANFAVEAAVEKARLFGIGCVTTCNTNDIARLGSYLTKHGKEGFIVILAANDAGTGASVAPWGGVEAFLSTNPIAAVIPSHESEPILIDVSTGITSVGKIRMAANSGEEVPAGFLMKPDGSTTTDPNSFFQSPKYSSLLPLGGFLAGHKGYALGLLVEALAGALTGAGCSSGRNESYSRNGLFVLAIDPEKFGGLSSFQDSISELIGSIKDVQKLPGVEEILIPGERASRERLKREKDGIPVDDLTWAKLMKICEEAKINIK